MRRTVRVLLPLAAVLAGCGGSAHHTAATATTAKGGQFRYTIGTTTEPATAARTPVPQSAITTVSTVSHVTVAGQRVTVITPNHQTDTALLVMHDAGENGDTDLARPLKTPVIAALVTAGYVWAESDASGDNWGNAASVDQQLAVAAYLRHHGIRRFIVVGFSMGGLDAIKVLARLHAIGWIGFSPVCDVRTLPARLDASIARAKPLGVAPVTVPAQAKGLPMLFFASPADTVVPKATNTDRCAAAARRVGAHPEVVTTRGDHDDPSTYAYANAIRVTGFVGEAYADAESATHG